MSRLHTQTLHRSFMLVVILALLLFAPLPGNAAEAGKTKEEKSSKSSDVVALVISGGMVEGDLVMPAASAATCLLQEGLQRFGVQVRRVDDPTRSQLQGALRRFSRAAANARLAIVSYTGFTFSYRGANRLIASDARWRTRKQLVRGSVPLHAVIQALRKAKVPAVVLLDGGYAHPSIEKLARRRANRIAAGLARVRKYRDIAVLLAAPLGNWRSISADETARLPVAFLQTLATDKDATVIQTLQHVVSKIRMVQSEQHGILVSGLVNKKLHWPLAQRLKVDRELPFSDDEEKDWQPRERFSRCMKLAKIKQSRIRGQQACNKVLKLRSSAKGILSKYRALLDEYPHAPCREKVQELARQVRENRLWKRIATSDDPKDFERFLKRFPDGVHANEARRRREDLLEQIRLRDRKAFLAARDEADLAVRLRKLKQYLRDFPDGAHVEEAEKRIATLQRQLKEKKAFDTAATENSIKALQAFIERYPNSIFVAKARERIERIRQRQQEEARRWQAIAEHGKLEDFLKFVEDFPDSKYLEEASRRIRVLEEKRKLAEAKEKCASKFDENIQDVRRKAVGRFLCVAQGQVAERLIPLDAVKMGQWYFHHDGNVCRIWTYPLSVSGKLESGEEPVIAMKRADYWDGKSIWIGLTRRRLWAESSEVTLHTEDGVYTLSRDGDWLQPRATGPNTISDEVTKALRRAYAFSLSGTSASGEHLEINFSAYGFTAQFRRMASTCGKALVGWIDDWSAVVHSDGSFWWNFGHDTRSEAVKAAMRNCQRRSSGYCQLVRALRNQCFALYRAMSGGWNLAVAKTIEDAKSKALAACEAEREGCYLSATMCADGSEAYNNTDPPRPSLTWHFSNASPFTVAISFYSQYRNRAWPGGNRVYVISPDEEETFKLNCRWGEKICFGAWHYGDAYSGYWGCGRLCRQACSSCCNVCKGNSATPIRLR